MALATWSKMGYIELTMKHTLTVTQGQARFPALCRKEKTSAITRNGEVVAFIVPRKRMEGLFEQMEILANPDAMAAIRRAKAGFNFSGSSPDGKLVEIIEYPNHPFFIACQYHPEFQSKPDQPHPLFKGFIAAAHVYLHHKPLR